MDRPLAAPVRLVAAPLRLAAALVAVVLLTLVGCGPAAPASSAPVGSAGRPSVAPTSPSSPSPEPSLTPVPTSAAGSGSAGGPVRSPEDALARVIEFEPRFGTLNLPRRDPQLVGGCCWYDARQAGDGYVITISVGWGDCPAGCINHHEWTYQVTGDGSVTLTGESGDSVPEGPLPPPDGF